MKKLLFLALTIFILSGCSTYGGLTKIVPIPTNSIIANSHKLSSSADLQYMSCDTKSWFVGNNGNSYGSVLKDKQVWASSMHALPSKHKNVASKAIPFAIMANNVYRSPDDKPIFSLPYWSVVDRQESDSGLALEEWHKIVNGKIVEVAIVYKGTDAPSLKDWRTNLSIWFEPKQYAEAQVHFENLLNKTELNSIPITVTGHSLGGGIAINVSLRHSTTNRPIRTFAFNTSPRGFYKPVNYSVMAERYLLDEKGEFLSGARPFWHSKLKVFSPLTYNFLDFTTLYSKPFNEHSIYLFSRALLLVAIGNDDDYSKKVFRANFTMGRVIAQIPSAKKLAFDKERDIKLCQDILVE